MNITLFTNNTQITWIPELAFVYLRYNKIKSMENIISFVEKYVQYPFMVALGVYLVYHLGLGCM